MASYRIEYSIQRAESDEGDFEEVGFGSSGGWSTPAEAAHMLSSAVQNYGWETEKGQPDPDEIKADVERGGSDA